MPPTFFRRSLHAIRSQALLRNMYHPQIRHFFTCIAFLLFGSITVAQSLQFNIVKGGDIIGNIKADRVEKADAIFYSMVSSSEFSIVWSNTVESTTETEYRNGFMHTCGARMSVNKSMRDSSSMERVGDQAHCYIHPNKRFMHKESVEWTTARMYYEEPVGQSRIFVESEMAFCLFEPIGSNTYRLHLSGGKVNEYTYVRGELKEIKVIRTLFDLYFKRV